MDHQQCTALLQDPGSRLHQLWGSEGWVVRSSHQGACWQGDGWQFFDDAWWGRSCSRNWYTGNAGDLGKYGPTDGRRWPHFTAKAPAVLGFDRDINWLCHGSDKQHALPCVNANANILSLYGNETPYNMCRNLEWQVCATKGILPGQGSDEILFAFAPKDLELHGDPFPLGGCSSYAPKGCGTSGYASADIFFLEVCVYDAMCSNRNSLWQLEHGEIWHCKMEYDGYMELYQWILQKKYTRHTLWRLF